MPIVYYGIRISPEHPQITVSLEATAEKLTIKETGYDLEIALDPLFPAVNEAGELTPSFLEDFLTAGVIIADAVTGGKLLKEIGENVSDAINQEIKNQLSGAQKDIPVKDALTTQISIAGTPFTLSPASLSLSSHGGYIMAAGDLSVQ